MSFLTFLYQVFLYKRDEKNAKTNILYVEPMYKMVLRIVAIKNWVYMVRLI